MISLAREKEWTSLRCGASTWISRITLLILLSLTSGCMAPRIILPDTPYFTGTCSKDLHMLVNQYVLPIEAQRR